VRWMHGYIVLGIVTAGVAGVLFRFILQHLRLDERILKGDAKLLDEKGVNVEHVTQAPAGTQFFPPGTKLILSGQAAVDLQNNLRKEVIDRVPSGTIEDETKAAQ